MRYLVPVIIPTYLLWCGEIVALCVWQRHGSTDLKASSKEIKDSQRSCSPSRAKRTSRFMSSLG